MIASEIRAIPVSLLTSIPAGLTSEVPSNTDTTGVGATMSARPVIPSRMAITVSNIFKT